MVFNPLGAAVQDAKVKSSQSNSLSKSKPGTKPTSVHSRLGLPISSSVDRGRSSKDSLPERSERSVQRPLTSTSASRRSVRLIFYLRNELLIFFVAKCSKIRNNCTIINFFERK